MAYLAKRGDSYKGMELRFKYKVLNGVPQVPPIPIVLTGCTIRATFRFGSKNGKTTKEFSLSDGIVIIDGIGGRIMLLENKVINWEFGDWYFDVEITFPTTRIKTYIQDILTVTQDITN